MMRLKTVASVVVFGLMCSFATAGELCDECRDAKEQSDSIYYWEIPFQEWLIERNEDAIGFLNDEINKIMEKENPTEGEVADMWSMMWDRERISNQLELDKLYLLELQSIMLSLDRKRAECPICN